MRLRALAILALALAVPAAAAEPVAVASARAGGLIGERYDGYIGVAGTVTPAVRSQVGSINITRRALYAQLASRRGVTPQEVAITAGCSLIGATPVGGVYWLSDEAPRRRLAGQAAPTPDYCR